MIQKLEVVTIVVRDYDEALAFYTEKLGFTKISDQVFGPGIRWITVAPAGQSSPQITLQKPEAAMHGEAHAKQMLELVGKNPTWSFNTDDCRKTYEELKGRGVHFSQPPTEQMWGVEALFQDLYGNTFSLLEPRSA
jgi:predicted enzyme related to lactoylglutathione lyase